MTTKLPDQGDPKLDRFELPPDPMIDGMKTAATNYLTRVAEASTTVGGVSTFNPRLLARAALAFESEIRLTSLGRIVDHRGGSRYDGADPVVLEQSDADVAALTNELLGIARWITAIIVDPFSPDTADGTRRYTKTRAQIRNAFDAFNALNTLNT